jgi:hypothetical protein
MYDVTLTVGNIYGCTDSITIGSSVNVGIEDIIGQNDMAVYPNPASDVLNVVFNAKANDRSEYMIKDAVGNLVETRSISAQPGVNNFEIDVTQLSGGSYVLILRNGNHELPIQFVINRNQ